VANGYPVTFERAHTVTDFYDGPRAGVADYCARPHYYSCEWDEHADDYADTFEARCQSLGNLQHVANQANCANKNRRERHKQGDRRGYRTEVRQAKVTGRDMRSTRAGLASPVSQDSHRDGSADQTFKIRHREWVRISRVNKYGNGEDEGEYAGERRHGPEGCVLLAFGKPLLLQVAPEDLAGCAADEFQEQLHQ
jgi:hypothetical protein